MTFRTGAPPALKSCCRRGAVLPLIAELFDRCSHPDGLGKNLKAYRRIWWILYVCPPSSVLVIPAPTDLRYICPQSIDVFCTFANLRRPRLLEDTSSIPNRTEDDVEADAMVEASAGLLSALTPQQKAMPVVHCELSLIGMFIDELRLLPSREPLLTLNSFPPPPDSRAMSCLCEGTDSTRSL